MVEIDRGLRTPLPVRSSHPRRQGETEEVRSVVPRSPSCSQRPDSVSSSAIYRIVLLDLQASPPSRNPCLLSCFLPVLVLLTPVLSALSIQQDKLSFLENIPQRPGGLLLNTSPELKRNLRYNKERPHCLVICCNIREMRCNLHETKKGRIRVEAVIETDERQPVDHRSSSVSTTLVRRRYSNFSSRSDRSGWDRKPSRAHCCPERRIC